MNTQLNDIAIIPLLPGNPPEGAKPASGGDENPSGDAFSTAFARAKANQVLRPAGRAMSGTNDPANASASPKDEKAAFATTGESAETEAAKLSLSTTDPALDLALLQSMRDQAATPDADATAASPPLIAEALLPDTASNPSLTVAMTVAAMPPPAGPMPGLSRGGKEAMPVAAPAPGSASRPAFGEVLSDLGAGVRTAPNLGVSLGTSLPASAAAEQERGFEAALAKLESGTTQGAASTPATPNLSPLAAPSLTAPTPQRMSEAPPPVTATVHAPLPSPAFPEEAAQRLTWLVKNGVEQASMRVTPPDMGPIEIRIRLTQDEATIAFAVTQPESGRAIEDAMPRLREMLSESGISLGHTSVESGNGGQFAAEEERARQLEEAQQSLGTRTAAQALTTPTAAAPSRGVGLVDLFA